MLGLVGYSIERKTDKTFNASFLIDHQYHQKWAMLTDPKSLLSEAKGYVKCNVSIKARGEKVRVHPETDDEDDIEG